MFNFWRIGSKEQKNPLRIYFVHTVRFETSYNFLKPFLHSLKEKGKSSPNLFIKFYFFSHVALNDFGGDICCKLCFLLSVVHIFLSRSNLLSRLLFVVSVFLTMMSQILSFSST